MEREDGGAPAANPAEALQTLQASHRAQSHVDFRHVHPSWLERAGQDESPAVRRLLASAAAVAGADPQVAGWVRALATERLVGGEPVSSGDPPVIVALAGLSRRDGVRLASAIGRAKLALAELPALETADPIAERAAWYRERLRLGLGGETEKLRQWARSEVERADRVASSPRRAREYLGMTTLARLLSACEPFRVRWALQHLPYPLAKRFRALMAAPGQDRPVLRQVEEVILRSAWERLDLEHRVGLPYPGPAARPSDVH
jgi:hypothetical protein